MWQNFQYIKQGWVEKQSDSIETVASSILCIVISEVEYILM